MTCAARLWFLSAAALGLAACTQFPDLDSTRTAEIDAADYPDLVPLEPLLAQSTAPATDPVATEAALSSRLAGLRGRANGMRDAVLSNTERERLAQGLR